jgi:hypothetical protein
MTGAAGMVALGPHGGGAPLQGGLRPPRPRTQHGDILYNQGRPLGWEMPIYSPSLVAPPSADCASRMPRRLMSA